MKIDDAVRILKYLHKNCSLWDSEKDAIKVILKEREYLVKEVANLARESVEREKKLAELECEVSALKFIVENNKDDIQQSVKDFTEGILRSK